MVPVIASVPLLPPILMLLGTPLVTVVKFAPVRLAICVGSVNDHCWPKKIPLPVGDSKVPELALLAVPPAVPQFASDVDTVMGCPAPLVQKNTVPVPPPMLN